jgi:hypothetical protein
MDKEKFFKTVYEVEEVEKLKEKTEKTEGDKAVIAFFDKIYEAAETTEEK